MSHVIQLKNLNLTPSENSSISRENKFQVTTVQYESQTQDDFDDHRNMRSLVQDGNSGRSFANGL